jgi:hypothetical protein
MRLLIVLFALLFSSCVARTYDCGDVDVEVARVLVLDEYPDVVDVYDRMDFYCVADTNTFQTCARAGYSRTEGCTLWLGSGPYRGKTVIDSSEPFTVSVMHEAQHWHLMQLNGDEGCPSHQSACGWID